MNRWPLTDAKARFNAMLDACLAEGPQLVTRHGVEIAVLVRVDEWRRLQAGARPSLKQLLLTKDARFGAALPVKARGRRRPPLAAR